MYFHKKIRIFFCCKEKIKSCNRSKNWKTREMVMLVVVVVTLFSIIEKGKKFWCSTLLIIEFSALLLWRSK